LAVTTEGKKAWRRAAQNTSPTPTSRRETRTAREHVMAAYSQSLDRFDELYRKLAE
jgi:hypothetical protein